MQMVEMLSRILPFSEHDESRQCSNVFSHKRYSKMVLPLSTPLQIFLRRVALYPTSQTTHNRNIRQHPSLSAHMEMLQEESECRAVSRNKDSEAQLAHCIAFCSYRSKQAWNVQRIEGFFQFPGSISIKR